MKTNAVYLQSSERRQTTCFTAMPRTIFWCSEVDLMAANLLITSWASETLGLNTTFPKEAL